jgi:hypothetical protein
MTGWPMKKEDAVWLAGLIEGEGYFGMWNAKTRWRKNPTKYIQLGITHTDFKLKSVLEGLLGRRACPRTRKKEWGDDPEHSKPAWRITVHNRKAYLILKQIAPYMRGEKREKADQVIREYEERLVK